jgi:hypothetical protein
MDRPVVSEVDLKMMERCVEFSKTENVEPCAMCSIRETRISKVVFATRSPLMGGFSKFGILHDAETSEVMPDFSVIHRRSSAACLSAMLKSSGVTTVRLSGRSSDIAVALVAIQPRTAMHWHRSRSPLNWRQIAHMMISGEPHKRVSPTEVQPSQSRSNTQGKPAPVADVEPGSRAVD